ncbi:MAG TPA: hypothetical protein VK741_25670 [Acetobacteraceae bacterium]|nr:hypothetical protein [Acetobacteraceae bacterium]
MSQAPLTGADTAADLALLRRLAAPVSAAYAAYAARALPWFVSPSGTCQVYRALLGDVNVFSFGPTEDFREWLVDFLALDVPVKLHPSFGRVHLGFWDDMQDALAAITAALSGLGWPPYYFASHSKGNEHILAGAVLTDSGHPPLAMACFEPPCVAGPDLTAFFQARQVPVLWTKTINATGADIVTQVPDGPAWQHQGVEIMLTVPDSDGIAQKHEWPAVLAALAA